MQNEDLLDSTLFQHNSWYSASYNSLETWPYFHFLGTFQSFTLFFKQFSRVHKIQTFYISFCLSTNNSNLDQCLSINIDKRSKFLCIIISRTGKKRNLHGLIDLIAWWSTPLRIDTNRETLKPYYYLHVFINMNRPIIVIG